MHTLIRIYHFKVQQIIVALIEFSSNSATFIFRNDILHSCSGKKLTLTKMSTRAMQLEASH